MQHTQHVSVTGNNGACNIPEAQQCIRKGNGLNIAPVALQQRNVHPTLHRIAWVLGSRGQTPAPTRTRSTPGYSQPQAGHYTQTAAMLQLMSSHRDSTLPGELASSHMYLLAAHDLATATKHSSIQPDSRTNLQCCSFCSVFSSCLKSQLALPHMILLLPSTLLGKPCLVAAFLTAAMQP